MRIEYKKYETFDELYLDLLPNGKIGMNLDGFIFRGEGSAKYKLLPSALRKENVDKLYSSLSKPIADQYEWEYWQCLAEYSLLRDFFKKCNEVGLKVPYVKLIRDNYLDFFPETMDLIPIGKTIKWISNDIADLAALAQHYGVITRLLDWTQELNVALYFASRSACKNEDQNDNMIIWALNAQHIQFLQRTVDRIPLNFVVPSYYDNPNLNAQKGILSYWESTVTNIINSLRKPDKVDRASIDEKLKKYCVQGSNNVVLLYKFELPISESKNGFRFINKLGYSASRLFPGYNGVTKELEERLLFR